MHLLNPLCAPLCAAVYPFGVLWCGGRIIHLWSLIHATMVPRVLLWVPIKSSFCQILLSLTALKWKIQTVSLTSHSSSVSFFVLSSPSNRSVCLLVIQTTPLMGKGGVLGNRTNNMCTPSSRVGEKRIFRSSSNQLMLWKLSSINAASECTITKWECSRTDCFQSFNMVTQIEIKTQFVRNASSSNF